MGDITTGAGNDIERASKMARKMVCEWGMSDKIGPQTVGEHEEEVFLGREWGHTQYVSDDMSRLVDSEIKSLIDDARQRCTELLTSHLETLHAVAQALLERETITGDDIDLIMHGKPLPPFGADDFRIEQEESVSASSSVDPQITAPEREDADGSDGQQPPSGDDR